VTISKWTLSAHLDVAARVKAVQLVDDLQHGALHLVVAARAVVEASAANGVDLQAVAAVCQ